MHKLCIIDNIWSGHFPPNVFGFGINEVILYYYKSGMEEALRPSGLRPVLLREQTNTRALRVYLGCI